MQKIPLAVVVTAAAGHLFYLYLLFLSLGNCRIIQLAISKLKINYPIFVVYVENFILSWNYEIANFVQW